MKRKLWYQIQLGRSLRTQVFALLISTRNALCILMLGLPYDAMRHKVVSVFNVVTI